MSATKTLPDSAFQSKTVPSLSDEMLRALADALESAFSAAPVAVPKAQRIVELAGAQWVGVQKSDVGPFIIFRDPVCGSTCMLRERGLSIPGVLAKLESKRAEFGLVIS
jgi:hypothetical protein